MSHSGTLYVVATPIGNLQDITLRALETLKTVDLVAAEDTRHTARLLTHFGLQKKTMALHEHNERRAGEQVIRALQSGRNVALVTDAGTPGISDPGAVLVDMAHAAGLTVVPLPGPCAAATALSAGGLVQPHFLFYGFLPAAGGQRRNAIESLRELAATLVFYEAPHRILDSVADLAELLGPARTIVFARELTKTFETIHRTTLGAAAEWLQADANHRRGEFVLLVEGRAPQAAAEVDAEALRVLQLLLNALPLKQAVKLAADITGAKKNLLYETALDMKAESP